MSSQKTWRYFCQFPQIFPTSLVNKERYSRGGGGATEPNFGRGRAILVKLMDPLFRPHLKKCDPKFRKHDENYTRNSAKQIIMAHEAQNNHRTIVAYSLPKISILHLFYL